jgi:sorbitol-specific phosphotransferase system component IIC
MEVLAITIFISLILAIFFVIMFLGTLRVHRSVEQEALLPLDDGIPTKMPVAASSPHDISPSL